MIPVVTDLKSSPMVHRFGDVFNPPGLTNFLGCVQSDIDIFGIRSLNFPPFACSDTVTANLYINHTFFPSTGAPITFTWYPDRIEREAEYDGLKLKTITALAIQEAAVMTELSIQNTSTVKREVVIKLGLRGGVTKSISPWNQPLPPVETDNDIQPDHSRNALLFTARQSTACMIQGTSKKPDTLYRNGSIFTSKLQPGEIWNLSYVNALGGTVGEVQQTFDGLIANVPGNIEDVRKYWNDELRAVFTPENDRYSGYLPTLVTDDKDILKLYHIGMLGVIYFKRDNPYSVYGRAYDTLMPRYWQTVTFLWDYSLSSLVHGLLDPVVMKKYLELWMGLDIHKHFGTEYLTGGGVGPWYSVNDFAMSGIARDYLRWTGDMDWLEKTIETAERESIRVSEYLHKYATNWNRFKTKTGLADYGGLNNLLECVNTYVHQVASLNAANVFNMRFAAGILEMKGDKEGAKKLAGEAAKLVDTIQQLYIKGKGYWGSLFPDGRLVEIRHCYDLLTILNTLHEDLSETQKDEITGFFRREMQSPAWMYALSRDDDDAMFSVRPDHQWTGAYPAWPPQTALGLYRIGRADIAFDWLKGLAKSANQGPFGQAHFAESVIAPEDGGARKAPPDMPYITDWTCSSSGSWVSVIIEGLFGVQATVHKGITASPQFGIFDAKAELQNLNYQGTRYTVTRNGLTKQ
jgi:hypothetical protein